MTAVLALVSVSGMAESGAVPQAEHLWATVEWWIGEMIGVLVVTPTLLIYVMPHLKGFVQGEEFLPHISFPRPSRLADAQILSVFVMMYLSFARIALLEGNELVTRSAYPIRVLEHDLFVGSRKPISAMPYCQRVLEQDQPVILHSGNTEVSKEESVALLLDLAQTLCLIPLRVRDFALHSSRTLGLLMVGEARKEDREPFTPEKMRLIRSIGDLAAISIENTRLFNDLERSSSELSHAYDATIAGWSAALDLRDKETEGHTQRVIEMTLRLAERMGFSKQELIQVRRGALLHDIGKMGTPDRILLKPDKLTDEEWEVMRLHPTYAFQMLKPITYLRLALDIPYCHHEKWDGTGYSRKLRGEQIPIAARIFAIVDVYDALRRDRPYRTSWSKEKTLQYIRELSRTHFDPQIVDAFLDMISEAPKSTKIDSSL